MPTTPLSECTLVNLNTDNSQHQNDIVKKKELGVSCMMPILQAKCPHSSVLSTYTPLDCPGHCPGMHLCVKRNKAYVVLNTKFV